MKGPSTFSVLPQICLLQLGEQWFSNRNYRRNKQQIDKVMLKWLNLCWMKIYKLVTMKMYEPQVISLFITLLDERDTSLMEARQVEH